MFFSEKISAKKGDNILEIGPGASPHPFSKVFLDKKFDVETGYLQRGARDAIKYSAPIYYYEDRFPFEDNQFDYVICSHVLEHVDPNKLVLFISEITRVSSRGYLEFPSFLYEYLFNFNVHKWMLNLVYNEIVLLNKETVAFNKIQEIYFLMLKYSKQTKLGEIIKQNKELFIHGYEWQDSINFRIEETLDGFLANVDLNAIDTVISNMSIEQTQKRSFLQRLMEKV